MARTIDEVLAILPEEQQELPENVRDLLVRERDVGDRE